jgi:hypothetical protein
MNNSLSVPFIVSNDGILPLLSVNISCRLDNLTFENYGKIEGSKASTSTTLSLLAPHEKTTGPCHNQINWSSPITAGAITIEVSHHPLTWVPKMTTLRSFKATLTSDGKTVWLPQ